MKVSEFLGESAVDPESAAKYLRWLFDEDDIVHISAFRKKKTTKKYKSVMTAGEKRDILINDFVLSGDMEQWLSEGDPSNPWNVYYSIAPTSEIVSGLNIRPGGKHACGIRQVFGDLDVKKGGFESADHVAEFVGCLSIPPGSIVWTGSGGAHVSWRIDTNSREYMWNEEKVGEKWWSYLNSEAMRLGFDVSIDRLIDSESRVLRLPGTVRWPKVDTDIPHQVVGYILDNPDITFETFTEATEVPFSSYTKRVHKRREDDNSLRDYMLDITERRGTWSDLILISMIDELVDNHVTWDEILLPLGWTILREGGDGSTEWTRPDGAGKSATTDWPDSPNIMSLFSTDEVTGLSDLKEADIPLTKWRVFLRLMYDDDVKEALDDLETRSLGD